MGKGQLFSVLRNGIDRIDFKLQLAGVRNVKEARALLSDHDNLELDQCERGL